MSEAKTSMTAIKVKKHIFKARSSAPLIDTTTTASPTAFHYEGCFDDNLDGSGNDRIWPLTGSDLQGKEIDLSNANAPANCREACQGYSFFGLQALNWCWCGNSEPSEDRKRDDSECSITCPGDTSKNCGGNWRMSIYRQVAGVTGNPALTTSTTPIYLHYDGCFDDNLDGSGNDRIWPLTGSDPQGQEIHLGNTNTPDKCKERCQGYAFFGMQAGDWCWCGKTEPPANRKRDDSECSSSCTGNSSQKCGGPWRMSIYRGAAGNN